MGLAIWFQPYMHVVSTVLILIVRVPEAEPVELDILGPGPNPNCNVGMVYEIQCWSFGKQQEKHYRQVFCFF